MNSPLEPGVAAALRAMIESGRDAFPRISLDEAVFEKHVLERAPGAGASALAQLHAAELYLACGCAHGNESALLLFDDGYLKPLTARLRSRTTSREDLHQAIRERLLVSEPGRPPRIADYSGRGSLAGWVRVAALRLLLNIDRGQREPVELDDEPVSFTALDPEMALLKARYRGALEQALRDGFSALEPHERTLLRQHFVDGLSIDGLAPLHGIHRATAARRLASTRARLLRETMRQLKDTHAIAEGEVRSLLRLVRSELSVSLRTLMG